MCLIASPQPRSRSLHAWRLGLREFSRSQVELVRWVVGFRFYGRDGLDAKELDQECQVCLLPWSFWPRNYRQHFGNLCVWNIITCPRESKPSIWFRSSIKVRWISRSAEVPSENRRPPKMFFFGNFPLCGSRLVSYQWRRFRPWILCRVDGPLHN